MSIKAGNSPVLIYCHTSSHCKSYNKSSHHVKCVNENWGLTCSEPVTQVNTTKAKPQSHWVTPQELQRTLTWSYLFWAAVTQGNTARATMNPDVVLPGLTRSHCKSYNKPRNPDSPLSWQMKSWDFTCSEPQSHSSPLSTMLLPHVCVNWDWNTRKAG